MLPGIFFFIFGTSLQTCSFNTVWLGILILEFGDWLTFGNSLKWPLDELQCFYHFFVGFIFQPWMIFFSLFKLLDVYFETSSHRLPFCYTRSLADLTHFQSPSTLPSSRYSTRSPPSFRINATAITWPVTEVCHVLTGRRWGTSRGGRAGDHTY